ncbi:hypothetical protein AVEN_96062-1 [Araneus ventricosus]|uniref:Uncharacterized protein n=1 Tax=Araneus ventricosus TaxID=182803 RepID=A0A4Y2B457_ARAVE|nr:hypothetical protein AVEN_96062-1 [Araneus ventricosus]
MGSEMLRWVMIGSRLRALSTILTMDSSPGPGARCPVIKKKALGFESEDFRFSSDSIKDLMFIWPDAH